MSRRGLLEALGRWACGAALAAVAAGAAWRSRQEAPRSSWHAVHSPCAACPRLGGCPDPAARRLLAARTPSGAAEAQLLQGLRQETQPPADCPRGGSIGAQG